MFHTNSTPNHNYKQQTQKIVSQIQQKTINHSPSPTAMMIAQYQKPIKFIDDQNPSTPQKFSITKNLKIVNIPSQANENSFRSSSSKNLFGSDSPLIQHNKENGSLSKRTHTDQSMDNPTSTLIQENKKLNEMIQRLFKEKQELVNIIEKQKNQQHIILSQQNDQINLISLKDRIERLEGIIDQQSNEILEWKQKYKQACESDERAMAIDQMESQIMQVVEENERLNNLGNEKIQQIEELQNQNTIQQTKIYEQEQKIKDQSNLIIAYEEDTKELKKMYKAKVLQIEKIEQQQHEKIENTQQTSFHENVSIYGSTLNTSKDIQGLIDQIQIVEQQLIELSTQYTSQVIENQKLQRQNNNLKEELIILQKSLDEIRNQTRGALNHKYQEANKNLKIIKDKLLKQLLK